MFAVVIQTLSSDRFGKYLTAAGGDVDRAIRLYIWNAHVGEAFHTPIQTVEVALRNSINHALVAKFGPEWWQDPGFLGVVDIERRQDLNTVKTRIRNRNQVLSTPQIVASLSFGFWASMLQPRYNPAIWSSQLKASFPSLPATETRGSLWSAARDVGFLRNRISHHEPIFERDLTRDFGAIMKLIAWVCPTTGTWIRPHCRVPTLVRAKP
jgi:hypothetical protein